jgi:hypothetical protein
MQQEPEVDNNDEEPADIAEDEKDEDADNNDNERKTVYKMNIDMH